MNLWVIEAWDEYRYRWVPQDWGINRADGRTVLALWRNDARHDRFRLRLYRRVDRRVEDA